MGFSIDTGVGGFGILLACLLAVPAVIFILWLVQLNRQVRHKIHDDVEDQGGDPPIA